MDHETRTSDDRLSLALAQMAEEGETLEKSSTALCIRMADEELSGQVVCALARDTISREESGDENDEEETIAREEETKVVAIQKLPPRKSPVSKAIREVGGSGAVAFG